MSVIMRSVPAGRRQGVLSRLAAGALAGEQIAPDRHAKSSRHDYPQCHQRWPLLTNQRSGTYRAHDHQPGPLQLHHYLHRSVTRRE
jgi:hypothetical protein